MGSLRANQYERADEQGRLSLNLRIDGDKFGMLEKKRETGWGVAKTFRNRSDVYNEYLGLGIQMDDVRQRMGERDFSSLWRILQTADLSHLNLERIEQLMVKK